MASTIRDLCVSGLAGAISAFVTSAPSRRRPTLRRGCRGFNRQGQRETKRNPPADKSAGDSEKFEREKVEVLIDHTTAIGGCPGPAP
jgi:hypothetical protein